MCVTSEGLNKCANWPESFVAVLLNFTHNAQTWKTGSNIDLDFLTINYIVLSSVLFGYGTFICINKIDIILWFYIYTNEVEEKNTFQ